MNWKIKHNWIIAVSIILLQGCGIYSFTGANVQGKTINVKIIENNAPIVAPQLSPLFTETMRNKVLNQTRLVQVNSDKTDYEITGAITNYNISVAAVKDFQTASANRLTISVSITFTNRIEDKKSFTKTFTKFGDYPATQTLQQAEATLLEQISKELTDAIFNDAFVNW